MGESKDWIDGEVEVLLRLARQAGLEEAELMRRFQEGDSLASLVPTYLETLGGRAGLRLVAERIGQTLPPVNRQNY